MKIAATYEKETGNVFQHFGKTQYFKIYEIEDGKVLSSEVIDNGGNGQAAPPYPRQGAAFPAASQYTDPDKYRYISSFAVHQSQRLQARLWYRGTRQN